jgi:FkbM family methyltransferase
MNISVICACKNRKEPLQVSLNSWLQFEEIKEIIIVDWNSDIPLNYLTNLDKRIKVIRVSDKKYFNQPQPLNLAASIATGDYILKLDSDYLINPYFNFIEKYFPGENCFTSGNHDYKSPEKIDKNSGFVVVDYDKMDINELKTYCESYSSYFKYLTGLLFVSKKNFDAVGGYNEILKKYYAYEDDEIFQRLRLYGLNEKKLTFDYSILHIPHPDKKRLENFESFSKNKNYYDEIKNNLSSQYSGDELEWQTEYGLTLRHIEENKKIVGEIKKYYTEPKTKWNIIQMDEQNYFAEEMQMLEDFFEKLDGFPSVYYISLEESIDRQKKLEKEFSKYNIFPNKLISKKFSESHDIVTGKYVYQLNDGTKGCAVSHLKVIKQWYENTDEDYVFICEDDLSLETIKYWNFTWNEFIESIPEDAECVQLLTIRNNFDTFKIRQRYWDDWGATAYIITRECAKKIIDNFIIRDTYNLEIPNNEVMPLVENILFSSVGKTYTIPLFVEEVSFDSTFVDQDNDVNSGQKNNHRIARELVIDYWKNLSNEKTEIEDLLTKFSLDTENPELNFSLGLWYESKGHTAPALSYYLRCAERALDKDLAYESLIRGSFCYEKQGERDGSSRGMLFQAQAFNPERPEAYFLLSRYAEKREWWQDCYINSDLALRYCNFDVAPLRTDVRYPGKYGLLFEKAVSGWWWGKTKESKSIFLDLLNNYNLDPEIYKIVCENLIKMGEDISENKKNFNYPENFDWGTLTHEDIVTIQREVVEEKVYRFWRDVEENDIVIDIGASVGAFAISILDKNPKKIYCVEPSRELLETLSKNCSNYKDSLVLINNGIVSKKDDKINIFGTNKTFEGITFNELIQKYNIDHVNYLKIDCEGGEYDIFKDENMEFLNNNVDFIAMEIHLNYENCRQKFKIFRDKYLSQFSNYKVMSCTRQQISWGNSLDIKDRIFDDNFVDNYNCEFMIYILNN